MSEAADADLSEDLILDPEPEEVEAEAEGVEEGDESADDAAARQAEAERAPLPAEELQRRYDNTRTALSEERSKRRELERRLEALESGGGRRQADDTRATDRRAPADEEDIDPDVDPIGAMKQLRAKVAAYEAQDRLERENEEQRQRRETAIGRVEQRLQEHETDFREDHPDYDDAARHYAQARARELLGFGISEGNVKTMLREEFAVLAQRAMEARKNPAAVVYEMAKGRGYKRGGTAKEPADKGGKAPTGAGAQTRLKDIARGARATSALQAGGGRSGSGADAETISRININSKAGRAQFEREFAKLEDEARRSRSGRR